MLLANTYHLALRPGEDEVAALGGLHSFMGWNGPILTDSGGFQVFSLSDRSRVTDSGVTFRSHLDGSILELTPERADGDPGKARGRRRHVPGPVPPLACHERGNRRGRQSNHRLGRSLQGGPHGVPIRPSSESSRAGLMQTSAASCAEAIVAQDFDGYAIGGVSVGEGPSLMRQALRGDDPPSAARSTSLLDGRRPPSRYPGRRRHRRRPLRLRHADAQRAQRNLFL